MKNGERRMENEHGNQKASTLSILSFRQSFPVAITISTFPVPMTSLDHPSRFNGWSLCIPNFKISTLS